MEHQQITILIDRHRNRLYRYILALIANSHDAEELSQQTCLTLWEKREEIGDDGEFLAWAFGVARNHVRNFIRKKTRRGEAGRLVLTDELIEKLSETEQKHAARLQAERQALAKCVKKLPEAQRLLIERHYEKGQTVLEIGRDLGLSRDAAYKAMRKLRQALYACVSAALGDREHQP